MRPYFGSAVRAGEEGEVLSQLMRDAAARGVTRHVLAADLHLRIEMVERILSGGPLFEIG